MDKIKFLAMLALLKEKVRDGLACKPRLDLALPPAKEKYLATPSFAVLN